MLFRRAGATAALADSIRNGDTQVAQVHGGAAAFAQLSAIPDVRTARIVTPRVMQLTLRAQQPKLADSQVRKAILGLLDVDLLAVGRRRRATTPSPWLRRRCAHRLTPVTCRPRRLR